MNKFNFVKKPRRSEKTDRSNVVYKSPISP